MQLTLDRSDGKVTRILLAGKLDVAGEEAIGDEFRRLIDAHNTHFLIDMSQVTYLASLGIRLLFAGAKTLAADGNKLVVLDPQPMVEDTLLSSGTAKLVPIAHGEDEALGLL
jgi:anti-sigma B factor antagonist